MKKEEGVTPIIGILLIVAITIILVGTIYFFATSYFNTPYNTAQLMCTLTMEPQASNSTDVFFTVEMSSPQQIDVSMVKIGVFHGGKYTMLNYSSSTGTWSNNTQGAWHYEAIFHDNNNNKKLDSGDEIEIKIVGTNAPHFSSGDSIRLSIVGYNGVATGYIKL